MPDAVRLAVGTLTAFRVPAPRRVTATVAGRAMLLAPVVGVALGLLAAALLDAVRILTGGHRSSSVVDLVAAVLALGLLALMTRGLHLDGLADTVDGLGVKGDDDRVRQRRLDVMRAPDVGAFGAVALVFTILLQAVALTECAISGYGTVSLILAVATGRLAATWGCTTSLPSARPDGLGAVVAGTVTRLAAAAVTLAVLLGAGLLGAVEEGRGLRSAVDLVLAVLVGLLVAAVVLRRCVARFGGITGDVLGAVVEISTTVVLVVIALAVGVV